jgi:hypothetical protein
VVLAALLAGACGSGAPEGPGGDDTETAEEQADADGGGGDTGGGGGQGGGGDTSGGGGQGGDGDTGGGGGDRYSWSLPLGDISPDAAIDLYNALRESCDEGAAAVEKEADSELVQLYRAAIAICRGDVEGGRELYRGAGTSDDYGSACLVREAVLSVLEQRPQNHSACAYDKIATTSTSGEDTPTSEDETTTEGQETTITPSTAAGGEAPTEPGGEGDDGA